MSGFIALSTSCGEMEKLQCLTTDLMQWDDQTIIMDIRRFSDFWTEQGRRVGKRLSDVLKKILDFQFGDIAVQEGTPLTESATTPPLESGKNQNSNIIELSPEFQAAWGPNPYVAILLMAQMKNRGIRGLLSFDSRAGAQLFKNIAWELWWESLKQVGYHHSIQKTKGFRSRPFNSQCKRLEQAIDRLGFKSPADLKVLNQKGVKSRYGKTLSEIWSWIWGDNLRFGQPSKSYGFPWKQKDFPVPATIHRDLDIPILNWDRIEPILIRDLDTLAQQNKNTGLGIIRLDWDLTLEDLSVVHVPIFFRNPYDLLTEKGSYTTALIQAEISFSGELNRQYESAGADPYFNNTLLSVGSWELTISERMTLPHVMFDFFSLVSGEEDMDELLKLENELPVPLYSFQCRDDWLPEDSFQVSDIKTVYTKGTQGDFSPSFQFAAAQRPLYIFPVPKPIRIANHTPLLFLESIMEKWWKRHAGSYAERHYYKYIDPIGQALWVFQNENGEWYQHGIFG